MAFAILKNIFKPSMCSNFQNTSFLRLSIFICILILSHCFEEINLDVNQNDQKLMDLFPDTGAADNPQYTLHTTPPTEQETSSFASKRAAVMPAFQLRALVGDQHQNAEIKQVRTKFVKEALSDQKFTKMRAYLEAIKNGTANRTDPAEISPPSKEALKALEHLNSIDRSKDKNVIKNPPSITALNEPIKDLLIGGDTLMTNEQMDVSLSSLQPNSFESRRKRQVQLGFGIRPRNKWNPDIAVSYSFDASIALFWNYHTCITFLENGNTRPIITFFKGQGCYSEVGRSAYSFRQRISIGQGCEIFGTITHEIGHALGFFHHQARTDRDQSLDIMYQNIERSWQSQYDKEYNTDNEGVAFDYGSVMLYTGYKPHTDVVEMMSKDKRYMHTMGNNWGPVFSDLDAINKYYHCASRCSTTVDCKNEGFQDSRNCTACICPNGFGGSDCSERAAGEGDAPQDCGETIQAEKDWKSLNGSVDPVMIGPNNISDRSAGCHFHIEAPPSERIEVEFVVISGTCTNDCYFDNEESSTTTKLPELTTINSRAIDDSIRAVSTTSPSTTTTTKEASNCVNLAGAACRGWLIKIHCQWRRHTRQQCQKFCGLC